MNVYEKLNEARLRFQSANVKKSGKNKFAGYDYYELSDILPTVNKICADLKATCAVSFATECASLEFIDCEKPQDRITFLSPMSTASLKGCHEVQNLGAVETYIKRYLYQNCFEIVESDALDMTMEPNQPNNQNQSKPQNKQNQPKTQQSPNVNLGKLKADVSNAIMSGRLQGGFAQKAQSYIDTNNVEGMQNVIQYLVEQEAGNGYN